MMSNILWMFVLFVVVVASLLGIIRFQRKTIRVQEQQIYQEKTAKARLALELENARTKQNVEEKHRTLSASDVDERLQSANYFRNDE